MSSGHTQYWRSCKQTEGVAEVVCGGSGEGRPGRLKTQNGPVNGMFWILEQEQVGQRVCVWDVVDNDRLVGLGRGPENERSPSGSEAYGTRWGIVV